LVKNKAIKQIQESEKAVAVFSFYKKKHMRNNAIHVKESTNLFLFLLQEAKKQMFVDSFSKVFFRK